MTDTAVTTGDSSGAARASLKVALGRRSDWTVPIPDPRALGVGLQLLGPLLVIASVVVGWPAFSGATGEHGSVALGLFVGTSAITLMAWSFLLAVRLRFLEPLFGGLDRMYQVHRWSGTIAVVLMFLHVRLEPEVEGGIRGASESVAESAEELAGVAEYMIYGLVAISLLRWFPYRWWRLTHKLLGIPFAFACWHFYTAEKPYANGSGWGTYFATIMLIGLTAYMARVVVLDMLARGRTHTVVEAERRGSTLELTLAPKGRKIDHHAGQFAAIKIQAHGLSEPHVFTIASSPNSPNLRFFIRNLGDWSEKLQQVDLMGATVFVEAPYGEFEPLPSEGRQTLWVAGGIGITPFLSAIDASSATAFTNDCPTLIYCVPTRSDATAIAELEQAHADQRIDLHIAASDEGRRFSPAVLNDITGGANLRDTHVAVCGPMSLVRAATRAARSAGARSVENEAFDLRSGIGPDLSRPRQDQQRRLRGGS